MKNFPFFVIVFVELATVSFLVGKIYLEQSQVLGENISINPISREDVIFPNQDSDSHLKNFYEPMPNTDITNKPDWLPSDYSYTITTNADSLNERFNYSLEKDPHVFRIVTMGSSYTFGIYVNTRENYPERLEDMLNENLECKTIKKFEVINLGVAGYDIEYSVHRFKTRGMKYDPDLLLWLISSDNDFSLINELIGHKVDQYRKEMKSYQAVLDEFQRRGIFTPWNIKSKLEFMPEIGEEGVLVYNKKALWRMRDYYKGRLVFITFSGDRTLSGSYLSVLQGFAKERGDTYIYDGLSSNYDRFPDKHPTSKGYEKIADGIFHYITSNHLIPCD